ncbi:serine hydrolase domain-containing protein [Streptomyces canus]|uniref:serine hydrolase domain-containing protein n=1 Tax=Streptomyces canus TaxID=58343 RepID=UPI0036CEB02E
MRSSQCGALALLTVCALDPGAGSAVAAPSGAAPDAATLQAALDRVTAAGAIGAVAEVRQGDAVWRGSSGRSRLNGRQPALVDGRFRAGSITKTFTATVVLQLVGEGRLRLSEAAERWLPGLVSAPGGDKITVRDLLQHASGLSEYTDGLFDGDAPRDRFRTWSPAELVRRAVKDGAGTALCCSRRAPITTTATRATSCSA